MKTKLLLLLFGLFVNIQVNAHVNLVNPQGGEVFNPGETLAIQWEIVVNHNIQNWDLYFSGDGGTTWEPIELDIDKDSLNFQWLVPDVATEQGQIRIVMDNEGGNYSDKSFDFTISTITGINEKNRELAVKVQPNPMAEKTTIYFSNPNSEIYSFTLYSATGQMVRVLNSIKTNRLELNRNGLKSGLYFFQLSTKNELRATGKLLIN